MVVWASVGSFGDDNQGTSIQLQPLDSKGNPRSDQVQVNTFTNSLDGWPEVAASAAGDIVVVWQASHSESTDTNSNSIQGHRFDESGTPVGSQFQINTYTTGDQILPDIAIGPADGFMVVWAGAGTVDDEGIQGQKIQANGMPIGGEFQINSYLTSTQARPSIAMDPSGAFIVVWESLGSYESDSSYLAVQGQQFNADATPMGDQFQVNSYTTDSQLSPAVALGSEGEFTVVWTSYGSFGSDVFGSSVQGQRFNSAGDKLGDQFQVNSLRTSDQEYPDVMYDSSGRILVAWTSFHFTQFPGDFSNIQGQRFATPIFTDGFESGDTSAWSSSH